MDRRKVVVTGASGMIAGLLLPALRERYDLTLLDVRATNRDGQKVEGVQVADLLQRDRDTYRHHFHGADAVVHCGFLRTDDAAQRFQVELSNVQMAYNVYQTAWEEKVRRVVVASSNHAADYYERLILTGDFQSQSGYAAAQTFLKLAERPTAILACNDMMAMGAICAIHQTGLRVPDDISVMGFDDIALASFTCPPLTTVAQAKYEMGALAFEMLREWMQDGALPPRRELLETELVIRGSCQPPRAG